MKTIKLYKIEDSFDFFYFNHRELSSKHYFSIDNLQEDMINALSLNNNWLDKKIKSNIFEDSLLRVEKYNQKVEFKPDKKTIQINKAKEKVTIECQILYKVSEINKSQEVVEVDGKKYSRNNTSENVLRDWVELKEMKMGQVVPYLYTRDFYIRVVEIDICDLNAEDVI